MKNYPTKKLGEVCEIKTGKRDANHGNPDGKYHFFTCADKHSYIDDYSFDTEAILVAGNGDVGAAKYFKGKFDAYQRTYVLHNFSDDIDVQFLFIFINGFLKKVAQNAKQGGTMPYIKLGLLKNFEIPLPSLSEQKRIVKILDQKLGAVREAIALRESALADTEKILSVRLREIFEEGKEEYEMTDLGEVAGLVRGPFGGSLKKDIFVPEGVAVYEQGNVINADLRNFRYFVTEDKYQEMKRFEVSAGDILMSCSGTIGRFVILPDNFTKGIINQALLKISAKENILVKYLQYALEDYLALSTTHIKGGAIKNIASVKELKKFSIPLPSLVTQQKIIAELDGLSARVAELHALQADQLADLKRLEKAYLREAFNGELY